MEFGDVTKSSKSGLRVADNNNSRYKWCIVIIFIHILTTKICKKKIQNDNNNIGKTGNIKFQFNINNHANIRHYNDKISNKRQTKFEIKNNVIFTLTTPNLETALLKIVFQTLIKTPRIGTTRNETRPFNKIK